MHEAQDLAFGGDWTERTLPVLRRYLSAYRTAMKNQPYDLLYVDAFAGTGYRTLRDDTSVDMPLFRESADEESQALLEGSAAIALQTKPPFDEYVFVEVNADRCQKLESLKDEFPTLADRITVVNADCNQFMHSFCKEMDRHRTRAVVFLDPFGMQIEWDAVEAVASTKAIDLWMLFPLGAVMRLLRKDGHISEECRRRLDTLFGCSDWYKEFYERTERRTLDGHVETVVRRSADINDVEQYYLHKMDGVFPYVLDNPRILRNSRGSPLFLLCFAVSNPSDNAIEIGRRLAKYIKEMED